MDQCTSDQLPEPIKALFLNYSNLLLKLVNVELQKDIDNLFAPSLVAHNLSLPAWYPPSLYLAELNSAALPELERENISNSDPISSYLISL